LVWLPGCLPARVPGESGGTVVTGLYIGDGLARELPAPAAPLVFTLSIGGQVEVGLEASTDQAGTTWRLVRRDEQAGWVPASHLVLPGQVLAESVSARCRQLLVEADDLPSIFVLTGGFQRLLALLPGSEADALFRAWRQQLTQLLPAVELCVSAGKAAAYIIADGEAVVDAPGDISDPEARRELELLKGAGYTIKLSEGMPYVALNPGTLRALAAHLSQPLARFADLLAESIARPFMADAALLVPWDAVRVRAMAAESWLREHVGLPEAGEVESWLERYMHVYLRGADNSPIFPLGTDQLDLTLKTSYEAFLEENRDSRFYPRVAAFYQLLAEHGFRLTLEVRTFMQQG
jgi:hypothetical protein